MSKKTSEAPKIVPAVKFPSLNDGYFEVGAIHNKRVHKVKFLLFLCFVQLSEYEDHFFVQFLLLPDSVFFVGGNFQGKVEYFVQW